MSRLVDRLRDPLWQTLGAIAAILTFYFTLTPFKSTESELAIVPANHFRQLDKLPEGLEITRDGKGDRIRNLHRAVYMFMNFGEAAIRPDQFLEPIKLEPIEGRITLVKQCPDRTGYGDRRSMYLWNAPLEVAELDSAWIIKPMLLNRGEIACVEVYVDSVPDDPLREREFIEREFIQVTARVINVPVKTYRAVSELPRSTLTADQYAFGILIQMQGLQVYAFIALQAGLFMLTYLLACRAGVLPEPVSKRGLALLPIVLLASASAQDLVAIHAAFELRDLHPAAWATLLAHAAVLSWLAYKVATALSHSKNAGSQETPSK